MTTRKMLMIKVGDDPVTVIDEPYSVVFDLELEDTLERPDRYGTLNLNDVSESSNHRRTITSYDLDLEGVDSFEFERNGDLVTIVINRSGSDPEINLIQSPFLEVWFPSPDEGSHMETVVALKSIAHGARFVATTMQKRNFYCDVEAST